MKTIARKFVWFTFIFTVVGLWSGCTEEQLFVGDNAVIGVQFTLKSPSAMQGKITIQQAYLKLDHFEISGTADGGVNSNVTYSIPAEEPPYQLTQADSGGINLSLPMHAYNQLDAHLYLFQDSYQLITTEAPVVEQPVAGDDQPPGEGHDGNDDGNNNNNDGDHDDDGDSDGHEDNNDDDRDDHDDDGDHDDDEDGNDDGDRDDDDDDNGDRDDDDDDGDDEDDKGDKDDKEDKKKNKGKDKGKNKGDKNNDGRTASGTNVIVNLDHFFQNAKPSIVVLASYTYNGQVTNMIFAVTALDKITARAQQNDSYRINLAPENSADVSFDPEHWFSPLTPEELASAATQIYQGQRVMLIHKDFNTELYNILVNQLEGSIDMSFRTPLQ